MLGHGVTPAVCVGLLLEGGEVCRGVGALSWEIGCFWHVVECFRIDGVGFHLLTLQVLGLSRFLGGLHDVLSGGVIDLQGLGRLLDGKVVVLGQHVDEALPLLRSHTNVASLLANFGKSPAASGGTSWTRLPHLSWVGRRSLLHG